MGQRCQVLRCVSCGTFQVHQVKKSQKWSCKVCGEKQSLLKTYGQGSGSDCRCHVQKLNLLRAGTEVAAEGTSWFIEEPVDDDKENTALPPEENLGGQEEDMKFSPVVSRWSDYLDKDSEDQEEEVCTDREQLCSYKKDIVQKQRKRQSSFHLSDAQECFEERDISGLGYHTKKIKTFENKNLTAVAEQDCGSFVGNSVVAPAITQAPEFADVTASKWEKFLSSSSCNNMTLAIQKSSWKLGGQTATAGNLLMSDAYLQPKEESVSLDTGAHTEENFTSNKHTPQKYATKLHSITPAASVKTAFDISQTAGGGVLLGKYKDHLIKEESHVAENEGRLCLACNVMPASSLSKDTVTFASIDPLASSRGAPHLLTAPNNSLFCTDEDFDDDL
ncbi:MRN complex-interacting protein [Carettochelys insculpta]|uniref:MRN complex-interacting protein n=1 Tax=Carettochelys insculpta TaxID=44489 RepID=UPI003EBFEDEE